MDLGTITAVRTRVASVPLDRGSVRWSTVELAGNIDYVLVDIETDTGAAGWGFTVNSPYGNSARFIVAAIEELLAPVLVGSNPVEIERLWAEMWGQTLMLGRRGAVARAISAIDVALWDMLAKAFGRPLADLLGRFRSRVPVYASGGYYYSEDPAVDLERLTEEETRNMELGFKAVKIKIGGFSAAHDRERVLRVLEIVGPGVRVAVDANNRWRDAASAISDLRGLDDLGLWWIEEPVLPDQIGASARIARVLTTPIATGELESGRSVYSQLVDREAAAILQPDATICGGITEWRKIAHMAESREVAVAPHWVPELHLALAAATPSVMVIEYFPEHVGILNFEKLLAERAQLEDGELVVPDLPGHGMVLDPDALRRYEVAASA